MGSACGKTTESFSARYGAISALERLVEGRHRVEADVLLPAGEVQCVATAEHDRGDAVADLLLRVSGDGGDDDLADPLQPLGDLGREPRDVLVDGCGSCHAAELRRSLPA